MGARWLGVLTAGLVTVSLSAVASSAEAKSGYSVWSGFHEITFSVRGTNGYKITVSHIGKRVELTAGDGDAAATYLVPAAEPSSDGDIEATFPGRGRVSVRFQPSGPLRRTPPFYPPECNGGGETKQLGTFEGTIRFRGERGFTRIATNSARGYVLRAKKEVCRDTSQGDRSSPEPTYSLRAFAKSQGRVVSFTALRPAPGSQFDEGATFLGSTFEKRRGMLTVRVAVAHADDETFAIGGPPGWPDSAGVVPPPPFQGAATFERTAEGRVEWKGSLTMDLPGASGLRLSAPSFLAQLCLNQRCTSTTRR
ncbi:MAG TPA: hypothetical protein VFR04_07650 [Solirubrobacterales bacterium]|nr:hypothetical protein [Solirubrobacterales bacterium]